MTPDQACRRIAELLEDAGGWGTVLVSSAIPEVLAAHNTLPVAAVRTRRATHDPKTTTLLRAELEVLVLVALAETTSDVDAKDAEKALAGRVELVSATIGKLRLQDGIYVRVTAGGRSDPAGVRGYVTRASRDVNRPTGKALALVAPVRATAILTAARTYEAATGVAAADQTGGVARVTWTDPPARYDLLGVRVRRAAGATPPGPSDGTEVASLALGVETYDDDPGAGEFSYSVLGSYDDDEDGTADTVSDEGPSSGATVTVT